MKTLMNKMTARAIFDYLKKAGIAVKIIEIKADNNEFSLDFATTTNISENELPSIEEAVLNILKKDKEVYKLDDKTDSSVIKFLKLRGVSGIVSEDYAIANRIFGLAESSKESFEAKLEKIIDLESRDHRKIGEALDLFFIDDLIGKGLPVWLPNGVALKRQIQKFILEQERKNGFLQVQTPNIGSLDLFIASGHYSHYNESIFPYMENKEHEKFLLRPMSCPMHVRVFKRKPRSYKELPIRIAEQVMMYRYEASGALLGLERTRAMELTDSHIFLAEDQLRDELSMMYSMIAETLEKFDIKIEYVELALHDPKDTKKYHGDPKMWERAENMLRDYLDKEKIEYVEKSGEAAFYGPKIDIQIRTAIGHLITVSTLQLDFYLPEKLHVEYIDKNNEKKSPIMVHRGFIGTYERFISVLLEQTKGNLPMWLAPQQAVVIPINNKFHHDYATEIYQKLFDNEVRVHLDDSDERLNNKIRQAQTKKIKVQIFIGDKEVKDKTVSYRFYGEEETKVANSFEELLKLFQD